jgi:hypothetical protein
MSRRYPKGMPFHGPVLDRKEASAVSLFEAFELKTFRYVELPSGKTLENSGTARPWLLALAHDDDTPHTI